jgi:anthranilate synthase component 2
VWGGLSFSVTVLATLLVVDNYDSFTYNLVQMFARYGLSIFVFRNDKITLSQAVGLHPDYLLISPGPKDPAHSGVSCDLVRALHRQVPILGVCLGMQCINEIFGGKTVRATRPTHGKVSMIHHARQGIFKGIPSPFPAARYHSLATRPPVGKTAGELGVTAWTEDGTIMAVSHRTWPVYGVQFHPESFMTHHGFLLLENFLARGPVPQDLFNTLPSDANVNGWKD